MQLVLQALVRFIYTCQWFLAVIKLFVAVQLFLEGSDCKIDPSLTMEQFVEKLQPLLKIETRQIKLLFMKMDG